MKISSVKGRPVNLDLKTIDLPIAAYVSIIHRITGILLCAALFFLLWLLGESLESEASFREVQIFLAGGLIKLIVFLIFVPFWYHLAAGIRHLIMDAGIGESLEGGRRGAKIVFFVVAVLLLLTGVWLWGV